MVCNQINSKITVTISNNNHKFRELFCLFCFCNTTLALDRIDVIVLKEEGEFKFGIEEVENELKDFDLDQAHWYYKTIYYYNYYDHNNLIDYYFPFQL